MMREWATVVAWQDGIATLHTEAKTSCNSCQARKGCGSHMLNKLGPKNAHVMQIASSKPWLRANVSNWASKRAACSVRHCWYT